MSKHEPRLVETETGRNFKGTGRIESPPDTRDAAFTLKRFASSLPMLPRIIKYKRLYELPELLPLDQGQTPRCTGYSDVTVGVAGPVLQKTGIATMEQAVALADRLWKRAQEIDHVDYGWEMNDEEGATTRSSMKAAVEFGLFGSYLWAESLEDVTEYVLKHGPAILGTPWTDQMTETGGLGIIRVDEGRINDADTGGHQIAITGVDTRLKVPNGSRGAYRLGQTWGRGYGVEGSGRVWLPFTEARKLWQANAEFVLPTELKLRA